MEFEGTVYKILPVTKGTSARGEWQRQDVVFEMNEGSFTRKICVTFFNKPDEVARLKEEPPTRSRSTSSRANTTAAGTPISGPGASSPSSRSRRRCPRCRPSSRSRPMPRGPRRSTTSPSEAAPDFRRDNPYETRPAAGEPISPSRGQPVTGAIISPSLRDKADRRRENEIPPHWSGIFSPADNVLQGRQPALPGLAQTDRTDSSSPSTPATGMSPPPDPPYRPVPA